VLDIDGIGGNNAVVQFTPTQVQVLGLEQVQLVASQVHPDIPVQVVDLSVLVCKVGLSKFVKQLAPVQTHVFGAEQ
jgi:hypothetical protein